MVIEFRNRLEKELNIKLSSSIVFNYPNSKKLAGFVEGKLAEQIESMAKSPAPAPVQAPEPKNPEPKPAPKEPVPKVAQSATSDSQPGNPLSGLADLMGAVQELSDDDIDKYLSEN